MAVFIEIMCRTTPVVGAAQCDAFQIGRLESWIAPILLDPRWNGGDYYGKDEPNEGVVVHFILTKAFTLPRLDSMCETCLVPSVAL